MFKIKLELSKSTGNLFFNNREFVFNNEKFISNNPLLKKRFKMNGFDTYGFEVVFFECNFSLNIIFKDGDFVRYFFLTFDEDCYDDTCLKNKLVELSGSVTKEVNIKPKKQEWKSFFELEWGSIELNAIRQDYSITMKIHNV